MRRRDPDQLTDREREVLELLRRDFTNEQIAQRLGISLDGAKYHVSQILSKLGVATREEAAAAVALGERRRWWAAWQLWAKIAGAATVVAAVAGLAVLVWGVMKTGTATDAQQQPIPTKLPELITWADLPAPNTGEPFTIPGVPPCQAADLGLRMINTNVGGGMKDSSSWGLVFHNKGSAPCFLGSTLLATFVTADREIDMPAERVGGDIVYLAPRRGYLQDLATPAPGFSDTAGGSIDINFCHLPAVAQLKISPGPGLGNLTVDPGPPGGWGTPCPVSTQSYQAHLSPEDCCGGSGSPVQTSLDAPASARPGERLRFLITVINEPPVTSRPAPFPGTEPQPDPTPPPLEWSPCPTYHQELQGVSGTFGTYRLNCEPVAPLAPYASATFEMYLDVPADARPGPSVLDWSFDGEEGTWAEASVNIWIEPNPPTP
jgi:DNA-binding CsgD family transcriptional regulator